MIASVNEGNRGDFIAACAGGGFWETRLPVDLALFGNSPASGWQFFAAPGGALALRPGGSAIACGQFDPEELGSMLRFMGVESAILTEGEQPPDGYGEKEILTCFCTESPLPYQPCAVEWELQTGLSPRVGASLLGGLDEEARENFFAECCARRNHGHGIFWGAAVEGKTVTTVSSCAVGERYACMFAGETLPVWRGKGIGGGLIVTMANHWLSEGKIPCFAARPERLHFYKRLGFTVLKEYKEYIYKE